MIEKKHEKHVVQLTNDFYTIIPHDFGMKKPPLLDHISRLKDKVRLMENLSDIQAAYSFVSEAIGELRVKHPTDVFYNLTRANIAPLEMSSDEAKVLVAALKNTHDPAHA